MCVYSLYLLVKGSVNRHVSQPYTTQDNSLAYIFYALVLRISWPIMKKMTKQNIPRAGRGYLRRNVYRSDYLPADIQLWEAIRTAASPTRWQGTHSACGPRSHSFLSLTSPSAECALCTALKWWVACVYSRDYSAGSSQPSLSLCLSFLFLLANTNRYELGALRLGTRELLFATGSVLTPEWHSILLKVLELASFHRYRSNPAPFNGVYCANIQRYQNLTTVRNVLVRFTIEWLSITCSPNELPWAWSF